jgi:hypothetical protein
MSVTFRVIVTNPIKTVYYGVVDFIKYIKYRQWRLCKSGTINCYVGLFGKGKTLSAVHYVCSVYKKYNNKLIYDFERKAWVTQKVHIISNVELSIPYEKFISLSQLVSVADNNKQKDYENNTLTVTYVLGDEFSVQLNSRSFKNNIDALFLNTLLTCRHHHIALVYTSQRFNHVDALLRQVTSNVITCNKIWRVMVHAQYDAYELETANNPNLIKSKCRFGWFITNKAFEAYDTLACVGNLAKSCASGDMLTESEILALQQNTPTDMDGITKPSRRFKKLHKAK